MGYNLPGTVGNLPESADNLSDNREPRLGTSMIIPGTGLHFLDSGKLHHSLSADGYQAQETAVWGLQVVN
ncbi:hypothetical protein FF2_043882 [Malus domestica]